METITNRRAIEQLTKHFVALSQLVPLHPIRSENDYDQAVQVMERLLDAGGANEHHPLADLVATLGELIADYDDRHFPITGTSPEQVLHFLMEQHQLKQTDLPEIGSQGVVSEVMRGLRALNTRQIKALAERFGVSPAAFLH